MELKELVATENGLIETSTQKPVRTEDNCGGIRVINIMETEIERIIKNPDVYIARCRDEDAALTDTNGYLILSGNKRQFPRQVVVQFVRYEVVKNNE